ncbi:MAG: hypothetical protein HYZ73_03470, partial [Elusimicrobia bacterium]|nr:hypothetical protein [Elusimicrobiota bacterium]
MNKIKEKLLRLAASRGIETSYVDMNGRHRFASSKSLQLVLKSLGPRPRRRTQPVRVVWDRPPFGYRRAGKTLVISAPRKSFQGKGRDWGLFLPLYALHSSRNRGAGDLSDLKGFARWAGRQGAGGQRPYRSLALHRRGGVEWLTLDRPRQLNAIDPVMADEL